MLQQELIHWIEGYVTNEGPVRGTQLKALAVNRWYTGKGKSPCPDVEELLNTLVEERRIVKLSYIVARTSPEVKTLYFPPGTNMSILSNYRI